VIGRLGRDLEPIVRITIHGRKTKSIEAVVDTGFSDYLCLAQRNRAAMRLRPVGREAFELADGRRIVQPVFVGEVTFDGERQRVLVTLTAATDSLIGTAMLRLKTLRIDFRRRRVVVSS